MWSRELGKQLYLGGFDAECEAARAFDVCSLKKWRDVRGASATAGTSPAGSSKAPGLNFPPGEYRDLVPAPRELRDDRQHRQQVPVVGQRDG